jgi:hypothetical protein
MKPNTAPAPQPHATPCPEDWIDHEVALEAFDDERLGRRFGVVLGQLAYLRDVLTRLPTMTNQDDLTPLLPSNWVPAMAAAKSSNP